MINVMSKAEYHELISTYDDRKQQALIDAIPLRINRAGKLYARLIKQICQETH